MTDNKKRPLGLYLHFPFCVRKCRYCDFLSFPSDAAGREAYLARLKEEILARGQEYGNYEVNTVFIGGGTPSLMSGDQMMALLDTVRKAFHIAPSGEWTMECNPGTTDAETLKIYHEAGINRLSLGLQSMNDAELRYLGRIHTVQQFEDNYRAARKAGFDNINIDLMSGLPGQTTASWMKTLKAAANLEPEHLSAYSLIIEEGTPFWQLYGDEEAPLDDHFQKASDILTLPDEDSEREMYHLTRRLLAEGGYERYEISNYARKGYACRHNMGYWRRKDYLGLGLGAASMIHNRRFSNVSDIRHYMEDFSYCQEEELDQQAQMEETMFLGLRCTDGVSKRDFFRQFGQRMTDVYGDVIRRYVSEGFLHEDQTGDRLALTERGMDVSNWILSDFLL